MNAPLLPLKFRCGLLALLSFFFLALPVHAGNIFFGLALNGNTLTLTNQGNSTAFYIAVLRLLPDGRWEAMAPPSDTTPSAELLPGAQINVIWPPAPPQLLPSPFDVFRPVMVRFFDQDGSSFGQISFFTQPPVASALAQSGYVNGLMTIAPPSNEGSNTIRASWLLWPQEEGIAPLFAPISFEHKQPPAQRIEWRAGMPPLRINLGAGLPAALLLHETGNGYALQSLSRGGRQGTQQRASWLNAINTFYNVAGWVAATASILLLWHLIGARRERGAA